MKNMEREGGRARKERECEMRGERERGRRG